MAGAVRAEAGDFDVVAQQVRIARDFVVLAGEELLLVIEAGSPGEIAADLQVFAQAVADHVLGVHALGRIGIVGTAGRVDVMVAGPPAELRGIDPALDLVAELGRAVADGERFGFGESIRGRAAGDRVVAGGQLQLLAVAR